MRNAILRNYLKCAVSDASNVMFNFLVAFLLLSNELSNLAVDEPLHKSAPLFTTCLVLLAVFSSVIIFKLTRIKYFFFLRITTKEIGYMRGGNYTQNSLFQTACSYWLIIVVRC